MEIAWAAGLFEGEGAICEGTPKSRARLSVKMTSEASVRRFRSALSVGTVYGPYGPYASQLGKLPYFMWVAEREDATKAAAMLAQFTSEPWRSRLLSFRSHT